MNEVEILAREFWARQYPKMCDSDGNNRFIVGDILILGIVSDPKEVKNDGLIRYSKIILRWPNTSIYNRNLSMTEVNGLFRRVRRCLTSRPRFSKITIHNYAGIGIEFIATTIAS